MARGREILGSHHAGAVVNGRVRRRRVAPGVVVLAVGLVVTLAPGTMVGQRLAVVARDGNEVVFHDVTTGAITGRVAVGASPHEIAVDGMRSRAYVPSYGGSTVHVLDVGTVTAIATHDLHPHRNLHGLRLSRAGDVVWLTAEEDHVILEIDIRDGTTRQRWPTAGYRSHMMTATPDDRKLYVANMDSGTVSVIDRTAGQTHIVRTGAGAEGIDVTPDGGEVWVSNRDDNTISVIDTDTDRVVASFASGGVFPVKLKVRPDGAEVWVANNRSETVAVFDATTRAQVATVRVGVRPLGMAFSPDGVRAFVTRPGAGEIVEIDVRTRTITRRIPTGANPDGIAWIAR